MVVLLEKLRLVVLAENQSQESKTAPQTLQVGMIITEAASFGKNSIIMMGLG